LVRQTLKQGRVLSVHGVSCPPFKNGSYSDEERELVPAFAVSDSQEALISPS